MTQQEYNRWYYQHHRDESKERSLRWYRANKKHGRAIAKAWREKNPDKVKEIASRYYRKTHPVKPKAQHISVDQVHFIGALCQRKHKFEGQEGSLRYNNSKRCVKCVSDAQQRYVKRKHENHRKAR